MKRIATGGLLLSISLMGACVPTHNSLTSNNSLPVGQDPNEPKADAPLTANTRFAAGQVAELQGDPRRAITQYEDACALDHTATVPLLRLGMLYTQLAEFDKAIDAWHRYIKATNGDASAYVNLAYTSELAQRFPQAEIAYKTAIQKQPRNETARVDYGLMLARQGRRAEAIQQLQVVLLPAEVHYNLASVLESQGKKEDARAEYEQALKLDPDMHDAQARLAAIETD